MSLSKLPVSASLPFRCVVLRCTGNTAFPRPQRVLLIRFASSAPPARPAPAQKQVTAPEDTGFFKYQRNWSRDKKYNLEEAPQKGDTPFTFMFRRIGHAYELYPLLFLVGFWVVICAVNTYWGFAKVEVWLDRSQESAPWDWSRIRDTYYKQHTVAGDLTGVTHQRCELMEMLQDEMYEAAKKRGTR